MSKGKGRAVDHFVRRAGVVIEPHELSGSPVFRIEAFADVNECLRKHRLSLNQGISALTRAMADAPNPWAVLGTRSARAILFNLWEKAQGGDREMASKLKVLVALLSPPVVRGRPRMKSDSVARRQNLNRTLDVLTEAIQSGKMREALSKREAAAVSDDALSSFVRLEWGEFSCAEIANIIVYLRNQGLSLDEEESLHLPRPTGTPAIARGKSRDRAGRFLAELTQLFDSSGAGPRPLRLLPKVREAGDRGFILGKWWKQPKSMPVPVRVKRTLGTVTRKRLSRARRPPRPVT